MSKVMVVVCILLFLITILLAAYADNVKLCPEEHRPGFTELCVEY